jgi:2-dehydropantoate 2-reductase
LTALLRCRNGELFKYPVGTDLLHRVCVEASAVFEAQWLQEQERELRELQMRRAIQSVADFRHMPFPEALSAVELEKEALAVARKTSGNMSSMLEDIRRGRPTEIDYINGYLVDMGQAYNVLTPVNQTLHSLVKLRSDMPLEQFL